MLYVHEKMCNVLKILFVNLQHDVNDLSTEHVQCEQNRCKQT